MHVNLCVYPCGLSGQFWVVKLLCVERSAELDDKTSVGLLCQLHIEESSRGAITPFLFVPVFATLYEEGLEASRGATGGSARAEQGRSRRRARSQRRHYR